MVEQTVTFLTPFKETTKRCEGDYITLDKVQIELDSLTEHFKEQKALYRANPSFLESIVTSWYAFDKYYKLIDRSAAYTAAILLHPNYRRSYIQATWQKNWVEAGVNRARALWLQYKKEAEEEDTGNLEQLSHYERFLARTQAKQRRSKGAHDELERFISAPPDNIDTAVID